MPHIVSTLSANTAYTQYAGDGNGANRPVRSVTVKGGANVANKRFALTDGILTPDGVATQVSDDDLEFLESNEVFKKHLQGGYVKVLKSKPDASKVAKDMTSRDQSAPLTPNSFTKDVDGIQGTSVGFKRIE